MAPRKTASDLTSELTSAALGILSGDDSTDFEKLEQYFRSKGFDTTDDSLWISLFHSLLLLTPPRTMAMYHMFVGFTVYTQRARRVVKALDEAHMWQHIDERVDLADCLEKIISRLNKLEGNEEDAEDAE